MTDRELLELAAKAAGFAETGYQDLRGWGEVRYGLSEAIWNGEDYWNPLTDDGDAFRLAVKLRLEIDIHHTGIAVRTQNGIKVLISADDDPDAYSATRRAIVRAAADMAKDQP